MNTFRHPSKTRPLFIQFVIRWLPVLAWMGLIFFFSSLPSPEALFGIPAQRMGGVVGMVFKGLSVPSEAVHMLGHTGEYLVLGLLLARALKPWGAGRGMWLVWLIALLFAFSDEIHQLFVPSRTFQLLDLALDGLGSLIGLLLHRWFSSR